MKSAKSHRTGRPSPLHEVERGLADPKPRHMRGIPKGFGPMTKPTPAHTDELRRVLGGSMLRQRLLHLGPGDFFFRTVPSSRAESAALAHDCREVFRQTHGFTEGWLMLSGRYRIEIEGKLSMLKRGDVVLLPPGAPHAHHAHRSDSYHVFGWSFFPLSLTIYFARMDRGSMRIHSYGHHLLPSTDLPEIELLERLPLRAAYWSPARLASYAGRSLAMLFEAAGTVLGREYAWSRKRSDRSDIRIEAIKELIRQRYYQDLDLPSISRSVGLSPAYCCDIFSRKERMSPIAYLSKVRLDAGGRLLATTDLLVKQVAPRVGFANANYFIRRFRRAFGVSPLEYRASMQRRR